jgi:tetratricopeptide (TPR) repeat protein
MGILAMALPAWAEGAPPATTEPATRPAAAGQDLSRDSALKDLGDTMTREEYEALVKKANENRLKAERKLAAAEINSGFEDPTVAEEAAALLDKDAKNTQQDNIERICQAFAKVDTKFGELWKLYNAKKYKEAVAVGKPLVPPNNTQSTYLMAAKAFVYSESLEAAGGDYNEAADAYTDLVTNMTDRISFAAEAVMRLSQLYEKNGRNIYAMQTYSFLLKNYGLTMDAKSFDEIIAKVKKLQEAYGDPMGTVAKMMSEVKERLAKVDSGKETQATEKSIVAMLDDLIKTQEDKDSQQSQSSSNAKKQGEKKPGEKPGEGEKESDAKSKLPNSKPIKKPGKNGAPKSVLRNGGDPTHGEKVSDAHSGKEKGDWSTLPPEEIEKLKELCRLRVNERYRDVIIDYHRSIAEDATNGGSGNSGGNGK